jgi:hypothetical protein
MEAETRNFPAFSSNEIYTAFVEAYDYTTIIASLNVYVIITIATT